MNSQALTSSLGPVIGWDWSTLSLFFILSILFFLIQVLSRLWMLQGIAAVGLSLSLLKHLLGRVPSVVQNKGIADSQTPATFHLEDWSHVFTLVFLVRCFGWASGHLNLQVTMEMSCPNTLTKCLHPSANKNKGCLHLLGPLPCISYFSHWCDRSNFRRERIIVAHSLKKWWEV